MREDFFHAEVFYKSILRAGTITPIIDAIHEEKDFSLVLYGGASLDILLSGQVSNDLDFLLKYNGTDVEKAQVRFIELLSSSVAQLGGQIIEYPGDHVVVHSIPNTPTIDIHYPKANIEYGLFRSETTVTGIGFDLRTRSFLDPLNGLSDLRNKRLVVHSPAYVISGPSAFPRLYRTALKVGTPLPPDVQNLVKEYGHMISIHDGRTNMRVLYEILKIFSLPNGLEAVYQMLDHGLLAFAFPEISPLIKMQKLKESTFSFEVVKKLLHISFNYKPGSTAENEYLNVRFSRVPTISRFGVMRFSLLFVGLGLSYYALRPASPYQRGITGDDIPAYIARMETNIVAFMLSRYQEHQEAMKMLILLPLNMNCLGLSLLPRYYRPIKARSEDPDQAATRALILNQWRNQISAI